MLKGKRENIYIVDPEVSAYLEKQPNKSAYMVNLIKKDMKNEGKNITKEEIIKIIDEYMKHGYGFMDTLDKKDNKGKN